MTLFPDFELRVMNFFSKIMPNFCWHRAMSVFNDLSIASTKTKYIKLNAKTQNIFCCFNENWTTFLYTLTGATRKQKCIQKSNVIFKKLGFSI